MVLRCRLEARQTIWNLRTHDLDSRPLGELIGELAAQMRVSGTADIGVRVEGDERALPAETQSELVRILQEATANALVHGRARRVDVTLAFEERGVRLR